MASFEARFQLRLNPKFGPTVAEGVKEGMAAGLQEMTRLASRKSPYRTGFNARGISWTTNFNREGGGNPEAGRSEVKGSKHAGAIFSTSGYGGYLETGTARITARPYIRPAVQELASFMLRAIRDSISRRS